MTDAPTPPTPSAPATPSPSTPDPTSTVNLDSRRIRGLAHPLRVRILDLLRRKGPATATHLAERLDQSTGATSYHLRQLATYGFVVEDTERGTTRERWWKAAHQMTTLNRESGVDLADAEPYLHAVADSHAMKTRRFLADLPTMPEEWQHSFAINHRALRLTPDETRRLIAELNGVMERYRLENTADAPADARPVAGIFHVLPQEEES